MLTRRNLIRDLHALGVAPGDDVMVHAALRSVGPILGGPDSLIDAILERIGPAGTLLAYTDWSGDFDDLRTQDGKVPEAIKADIAPFDPENSRSIRDNGAFPELLRTRKGALRSGSPGASCAALGGRADWYTAGHALDYGYGEGSPFAKLVASSGKVLMLGAPLDTVTLLHHAEHLSHVSGKRVLRYETPILVDGRTVWRQFEEFDTGEPVVEGLADNYFATITEEFLSSGRGRRGLIGAAPSVLLPARELVAFGIEWLENRFSQSA